MNTETNSSKASCPYIKPAHKVMNFKATDSCNGQCPFCFEKKAGLNPKPLSTEELIRISIEKLKDYKTLSVLGGEPLLWSGLEKYLKGVRSHKDVIILTTNGILLPEKWQLAEYIDQLNISIHGFNEATAKEIMGNCPDFKKLALTLANIRKNHPKINIRINCNLSAKVFKNKDDVNRMIKFASCLSPHVLRFCELQGVSKEEGFVPLSNFFPKKSIAQKPLVDGCITLLKEYNGMKIELKSICQLCSRSKFAKQADQETNEIVKSAWTTLIKRILKPEDSPFVVLYPDGSVASQWLYTDDLFCNRAKEYKKLHDKIGELEAGINQTDIKQENIKLRRELDKAMIKISELERKISGYLQRIDELTSKCW